jgi:hypothetical protein
MPTCKCGIPLRIIFYTHDMKKGAIVWYRFCCQWRGGIRGHNARHCMRIVQLLSFTYSTQIIVIAHNTFVTNANNRRRIASVTSDAHVFAFRVLLGCLWGCWWNGTFDREALLRCHYCIICE